MIRPFTLITMLLAALSGAYLFAVKHRAQVLDDQLAATAQQSRLDAQRIRVLQAQWALEIDPTRLAQLAGQFTTLQPMKPAQLVTLASLPEILPVAGAPPPGANPRAGAPGSAVPPGAASASAIAAIVAAGPALPLPLPPPAPPLVNLPAPARMAIAAPTPAAPTPAAPGVHPASHSQLRMAASRAVRNLPPPRPLPLPSRLAANSLAEAAPVLPIQAVAVPVMAATPASGSASGSAAGSAAGSALGMAGDIAPPPPLPLGTGN